MRDCLCGAVQLLVCSWDGRTLLTYHSTTSSHRRRHHSVILLAAQHLNGQESASSKRSSSRSTSNLLPAIVSFLLALRQGGFKGLIHPPLERHAHNHPPRALRAADRRVRRRSNSKKGDVPHPLQPQRPLRNALRLRLRLLLRRRISSRAHSLDLPPSRPRRQPPCQTLPLAVSSPP